MMTPLKRAILLRTYAAQLSSQEMIREIVAFRGSAFRAHHLAQISGLKEFRVAAILGPPGKRSGRLNYRHLDKLQQLVDTGLDDDLVQEMVADYTSPQMIADLTGYSLGKVKRAAQKPVLCESCGEIKKLKTKTACDNCYMRAIRATEGV